MNKLQQIYKDKRFSYLITYSVFFAICYVICYQAYFVLFNKAPIWSYDAIDNNYPMFIYVGRWWRELIKNFTIRHTFEIPMWDMSIGFGADIITSLGNGFNNFYNPFYIISAFFPADKSETAFKFVLALQMFFSGLSFSAMAYHKKKDYNAVLIGALCYVFSSNTFIVFKQSSFGYIFVIFPLIILGLWLLREGKKPYLLIFSIASVIAYSYYFAYMAAILICVYYVIEVAFSIYGAKGKNLKEELFKFLKVAGAAIIAAIIGFFMILPSIFAITKLNRLDVNYYIPLFRDRYYYCRLLYGMVSTFDGWTDDVLGFPIFAVICVFGLFVLTGFKERVKEKILFVIATLALILPFAGHVLNGFSYATNRWAWAYTLLVSFIVTITIDRFRDAARWKLCILIGILIAYKCILKFVFEYDSPKCNVPLYLGIIILALLIIAPRPSSENFLRECTFIMILALAVPPFYYWTSQGFNSASLLVNNNDSFYMLVQSGGKEVLELVPQDDVYRYDTLSSRLKNSSMITQRAGYDEYNSIYNNNIDHLMADLGIASSDMPSIINGIDSRSDLEALFGTQFIIRNNNEMKTKSLPYGYTVHAADFASSSGNIYDLYTTPYDTGVVFFMKDVMNESEYDSLSCYDKQQALMNSIILPDEETNVQHTTSTSIPYTVKAGNNVSINGDQITIHSDNSYIELVFDKQHAGVGEWYVALNGLKNSDQATTSFSVSAFAISNNDQAVMKHDLWYKTLNKDPGNAYTYTWGSVSPSTDRHHMFGGKDSWLLTSAYEYEEVDKIRLMFHKAGHYSIEDISVYFESDETIESNVMGLSHPDTGLYQDGNTLKTTVNLEEDGYVLITVPYSEGWTAMIDGKEAEILRADRAFMAFKLEKGQHDIKLKYHTPHLAVGLCIAVSIIVIFCGVELFRYKRSVAKGRTK
ncbi:MAG: YfhO family protein [Clostridiales bacterium]|nr:YfhO family protein [Clostridiales bacterium]